MRNPVASSQINPARRPGSAFVLSVGFSLTGSGTVMLGVLLPVFSQRWGLRDDTAGLLLFLQFFGSALGAVFTGMDRVRSLIIGYSLLSASSCALAFSGARAPYAIFFFLGLGLGMAMTSTSLLFSDRWGDDRAAKLEGLNFAWSIGATAGPMLFLPFLRHADLRVLFFTLLVLFLFFLAWAALRERGEPRSPITGQLPAARATAGLLMPLIVLTMCTVGVEASLSGWLTTYSHRAGLRSLAGAALATSLFWLGGMLSRLAFSTRLLAKLGRHAVLQGANWGVLLSVVALIAVPHPAVILAVAGIAGLSIGPLYPLLLSFLLERSARGWIFAVAGVGAAIFPWITGLLSSHFHSLRCGLIAPSAAALVMVVLRSVAMRPANASELPAPAHS